MPDPALQPDLMRSLGRLVRGLSILFWTLPAGLVIFGLLWIHTVTASPMPNALTEWLQSLNVFPPLLVTALLFYATVQLGHFQPQERIWQRAVERAKILALANVGLSPFLFWWTELATGFSLADAPALRLFTQMVGALFLTSLAFLGGLNQALNRLAAMLPDETLRAETRFFTSLNLCLLALILLLTVAYFALLLTPFDSVPASLGHPLRALVYARQWLLVFLVLVPVALTMTLVWKTKEVILDSIFRSPA